MVTVLSDVRLRFTGLLAAWLAAGACSSGTVPQVIPDISGAWTYRETTTSRTETGTQACNFTGVLTFSQDGQTFVGTYNRTQSCSAPGTPTATRTESGSIPRAVVTEHGLTFRMGSCQYQASLDTTHPDRLTGTALCTEPTVVTVSNSAGAWLADRIQQ